jgi:cyclic beta-1,2-glucan synthetase
VARAAAALKEALEREAWDGDWYRRAWFDDGTVLGSASNDECQIDSIVQPWAVISGVARHQRGAQAMAAIGRELIDKDDGLALLFTPRLTMWPHDPGHSKAYPPGIRGNGGQYIHAAAWSVIALARLAEGAKAADLFWQLNPINLPALGPSCGVTSWSPMSSPLMSMPLPITSGWGLDMVQALPGGCNARGSKASWVCSTRDRLCKSILASLTAGQASRWLRRGSAQLHIRVANPDGVTRGVARARMDGTLLIQRPLRFELPDDGLTHHSSLR